MPHGTGDSILVIGLGTGRCGTLSLARILNAQAHACVTHEERPLLPWHANNHGPAVGGRIERMLTRPDGQRLSGDVAFFYLPYVEEIISQCPHARFVCLRRDREETVESYVRWLAAQKDGRRVNHWSGNRLPFDTDPWDACYPKYETTDLREGIRCYWEAYYARAETLLRKYPSSMRIYEMGAVLNDEQEISRLLTWLGIPESHQILAHACANRGPRPAPVRTEAHDAVLRGFTATSVQADGGVCDPERLFRNAMAAHQAGRTGEAMAGYCDVLRIKPDHPGALHLKGVAHHRRGENVLARELIEAALRHCSTKAVYWNNYGAVLRELGCRCEAEAAFQRAVGIRDDYPDAWANLGLTQAELGDLEKAEKSLRCALRWHPRHDSALRHLAELCRGRGEYEESLQLCQAAASAAPEKAENHTAQGATLCSMKRFDEAVKAFERALEVNPRLGDAHLSLGAAHADLGELEKARTAFRRAAELRPDRPFWRLRHLGMCPLVFESAAEIAEFRRSVERQLDEVLADPPELDWRSALRDGFMPSFQFSHHGVCNRPLKEKFARLFASRFPDERRKPKSRTKIRVGFACTRTHEGGFLRGFAGVMERLDRRRFEVVGLVSDGVVESCRAKVRSDDILWIGFPHNLERALAVFRETECHVVVHWTPGTDLMNYFLPFLPTAPVQCIGFGMHGTTGIGAIDHCVSSRLFERGEEAAEDYTEELVLFESATSWQTRPRAAGPAARSDFGLPDDGSLYFCPQRLAKFHPDFDGLLRGILERDATGRVVVLAGLQRRATELLKRRFDRTVGSRLGERILFAPPQNPPDYLRLLGVMDVVLDMPTYSAALTGYDAFAMGVPVVTLPGRYMVEVTPWDSTAKWGWRRWRRRAAMSMSTWP